MPTLVKENYLTIGNEQRDRFRCTIGNTDYYATGFQLTVKQTEPNELVFYLTRASLLEKMSDATFDECSRAIGLKISVEASTETSALIAIFTNEDENLEGTVVFNGIVTNIEADRSAVHSAIKVTARSTDYLLTLGKTYRCFVNRTLEEIVTEIVENYQGDIELSVNPREKRQLPYIVQYKESDYEFLRRLAATYNEWLYCDGTTLFFGEIERKEEVTLKYLSSELSSLNCKLKTVNLFQDFISNNYRQGMYKVQNIPSNDTSEDSLVGRAVDNCRNMVRKIHQNVIQTVSGGNYSEEFDEMRQTQVSEAQFVRKVSDILQYNGTSYCAKLNIGTPLTIENNFITNIEGGRPLSNTQSQEMVITQVVHYWNNDGSYYNTFEGLPKPQDDKLLYPPYKAIMPPTAKTCTATVTDNDDPEDMGRIRVRFHWQQELSDSVPVPDDETKTPWLRVIHPYAGGEKGFSFIPEIGEEVLVGFCDGNPDKPYVMGTLYNGVANTDPAWLPENNAHNEVKAIRTRNGHTIEIHDEGDDGYIRIYDNKKENYILTFSTDEKLIKLESTGNIELYAQNDIIMHAGHDINASADNDVFIAAGHDMQRTADNDIREHAGNDRTTTIERNDSLTVSQNQFIRIEENKDETVSHKLQITAENIRTEAQDKLLEYSTTHHMKASQDLAVNASNRIDIKASQVKTN